jgi:hypothetical protein
MELVGAILTSPEFAAFVVTALVTIAGWLGKTLVSFVNKKLTAEQIAVLMKVAAISVAVAEQTGLGKTAEEKKAEAMFVAQTYLDAYGIKVNAEQLSAAIEAAVFNEINKWETPEPDEIDVPVVTPEEVAAAIGAEG